MSQYVVHYHKCRFTINLFYDRTSRLPAIYVFGKKHVDPADCVEKFLQASGPDTLRNTIILRPHVAYCHNAGIELHIIYMCYNLIVFTKTRSSRDFAWLFRNLPTSFTRQYRP